MKKMKMIKMTAAAGVIMFVLSSCGQTKSLEDHLIDDTQTNVVSDTTEIGDRVGESQKTQSDDEQVKKDDERENLIGEYDYLSDYGSGKLMIEKTSYGYDISDYESESSYRFLADSSNIETIENNKIYIKYPEQVFSDDTVTFSYYILEYSTDEISVYYGKSVSEEPQFLYHAIKKKEEDIAAVHEGEVVMNQQESNLQEVEDTGSEITADELLDSFINGGVSAVDPTDSTSTFYITDLNMDSEEWDSFSIGEKVDLDNDGENELVINGPYGGIYLDARDNKVYEFAVAEGTALILSYTYYNGAVWIMYSNRSSAGFEFYHMEKFEGADNLVAEMNFGEELADFNNAEAGMKYTLNEAEISYDEYTELCSKIFAAQVNTN